MSDGVNSRRFPFFPVMPWPAGYLTPRGIVASALLFLLLALCGCGSAGDYLADRGADFADVFSLEFTAGPGLHIEAYATAYAGTVVGYTRQKGVALVGRYYGLAQRSSMGHFILAYSCLYGGAMNSLRGETSYKYGTNWFEAEKLATGRWQVARTDKWYLFVPTDYGHAVAWPKNLDLAVGGSLGYVGAQVGFSPGEFLDFVAGLAGIDTAGDDGGQR